MSKPFFSSLVIMCCALVLASNCLATENVLSLQPLLTNTNIRNNDQYPILDQVIKQADKYRVQIIYTQIDRNAQNQPRLTGYQFELNEQQYFYPASTVKLPIALLALEWLQQHTQYGVNTKTTMLTDSSSATLTAQLADPSTANGLPNIEHYIKKLLLVSDNDASNRLYELLGQDYINKSLAAKGIHNTVINHRLSIPLTSSENRTYNPIRFVDNSNKILYQLPQRHSTTIYRNDTKPKIGQAYFADGKLINQPMDFTDKNRFSLSDFDSTIKRIVFPQLFSANQRFNISAEQRKFMLKYMSMLPAMSIEPKYDVKQYPDNYSKFVMFGGNPQSIPKHIKIFNKTGWSYGHVIDGAYIVDSINNVEFFLTAVVYANENATLNDDNYQIEQIALPFLNQLGNFLYQLELTRTKQHAPDLTEIIQITNKTD